MRLGASPIAVGLLLLSLGSGCALPTMRLEPSPALALHEVADEGDGRRRASTDLALQALDAEIRGEIPRAHGLYSRALQMDASNPYPYLALARHHAESGQADLALEYLARCEDLLRADQLDSPRVEVHLVGLRGVALLREGHTAEAERALDRAARAAPSVWGDGRLTARELR